MWLVITSSHDQSSDRKGFQLEFARNRSRNYLALLTSAEGNSTMIATLWRAIKLVEIDGIIYDMRGDNLGRTNDALNRNFVQPKDDILGLLWTEI